MRTLLVLFMTLSLSACSSTGPLKDVSRDVGKEAGRHMDHNKHQNNGRGPYGPGKAS